MSGAPDAQRERPWDPFVATGRVLTVDDVRLRCSTLRGELTRSYGVQTKEVKPAAALVPIVDAGGQAAVLATKRPSTMEYHRDDWVFPGGRIDTEGGEQPLHAAQRELEEELGVPADGMQPWGHLATYGPFVTGFLLDVFVGAITEPDRVVPNVTEVAEVTVIPLCSLMAPGAYFLGGIPDDHDPGPVALPRAGSRAGPAHVRFFRVREDEYLWGTQGEIVWDLLAHLTQDLAP